MSNNDLRDEIHLALDSIEKLRKLSLEPKEIDFDIDHWCTEIAKIYSMVNRIIKNNKDLDLSKLYERMYTVTNDFMHKVMPILMTREAMQDEEHVNLFIK
jgi:hypothetical protein